MTEPIQPTPDDATLPGRADVTRTAAASADDSTLAAAPKQVRPPLTVSQLHARERYALGCEVARGGMGAILRATDLSIDRTVAMKVALDQASMDAEILQRFTQEAKLTGQLEHPNIVPVYDLSSDEQDRAFYTMKFVQGTTLHEILGKLWSGDAATVAQYSLAHLLTIFQKVCDAVAFAHSRNVIHRDLKPANIMVGEYGEVLVMDWGLAKVVGGQRVDSGQGAVDGGQQAQVSGLQSQVYPPEAAPQAAPQATRVSSPVSPSSDLPSPNSMQPALTLDGQIMGSPQYMAPEQANGEIDKLDARTDIFALGGVLYNILTLHPPVSGKSVEEMLEQIRTGTILPPTSFNPKTGKKTAGTVKVGDKSFPQPPLIPLRHCPGGRIPESLGAVAMQALALKQEDRYQSVPELQKDIEAYQGGFATGAEKASAWRQLALLVKRHKKEFTLTAVALGIIVALVAGFLVKVTKEKNRAEVNERQAETERQRAQIERDRAEANLAALHKTAPTFYAQATTLIEQQQITEALEKISYAISVASEVAEYHVVKGNLLQATLQMAEARDEYAEALRRQPGHKVAQENLELCQNFLMDEAGQKLVQPASLSKVQAAITRQGRLAEAVAFAQVMQKCATDRAGMISAWSNVLARAGIAAYVGYDTNNGLKVGSVNYTNETLAPFQGMPINQLKLGERAPTVRDLRPLHGMPLHHLYLRFAQIVDLSPLRGMPLTHLNLLESRNVTDFTPLQGMPLKELNLGGTRINDLTLLQGMPLEILSLGMGVTNLAPLQGMRLTFLDIMRSKVSDLSPLRGMPLTELRISSTLITDLSPLTGMPLKSLNMDFTLIKDLSPLQRMPLANINMSKTSVEDLSPLKGLALQRLTLGGSPVADLSPLRGMPLKDLDLTDCVKIQDLTPLTGCLQLERLILPATCKNIECLRSHPTLKRLGVTPVSGLLDNLPTVAEFWKAYDAAKTNAPAAKPTP